MERFKKTKNYSIQDMRYIAVVCPKCGRASATRRDVKRRQCPYCGYVIVIDRASIIAIGDSKTVREAVVRHNAEVR